MDISQIYIIIALVVLLVIGLVVFFLNKNKKKEKLTPLTTLAFGFILAGILFGDNRLFSYSLMGTGVVFAIIDIIMKLKKK
ncbi:hypothetical protein ACFLZZ_00470 [Nanoarchaeota archaeon]